MVKEKNKGAEQTRRDVQDDAKNQNAGAKADKKVKKDKQDKEMGQVEVERKRDKAGKKLNEDNKETDHSNREMKKGKEE